MVSVGIPKTQFLHQTTSVEIDEREKAATELDSRFAVMPSTPHPNALQEVS
jgi:hypothetical protein